MADVITARIESNVLEVLRADQKSLLASMRKVVAGRAKWGKNRIREAVEAAGYGVKVGNAVRSTSHDIIDGVEASIFSKAKVRHAGGVFDLLALFQHDQTIRPSQRTFLAVPNPRVVGKTGRGRFLTPPEYGDGFFIAKVHAAYSGVLVAKNDPDGPPYFFLFRVVQQRGRLSLLGIRNQLAADLDVRIIREWRSRRVGISLQLLAA